MDVPADVTAYGDAGYWDARFAAGDDGTEWLGAWASVRGAALPHLRNASRILILGNGSSRLPWDLAGEAGLAGVEVVASDVSAVAVARGAAADPHPRIAWAVADVVALPFDDASFDAVVEKGVLDALAARHARSDPWRPPPQLRADLAAALDEAHRVLTPDGVLLSVSFAQPHFRLPLLRCPRWDWAPQGGAFGDDADALRYFLYVCARGSKGEGGGGEGGDRDDPAALVSWRPHVAPTHDHMEGEDYLLRCGLGGSESE